jgi:hypothetical protein
MQAKPLPNINVNLVINLIQDSFSLSAAQALRSIIDMPYSNALDIVSTVEKYIDSCDPIVRNHSRIMRENLEWVIRNELKEYVSRYTLDKISQNYMIIRMGKSVIMAITYCNGQFCFTNKDSSRTVFVDQEAALLLAEAIRIMSQ